MHGIVVCRHVGIGFIGGPHDRYPVDKPDVGRCTPAVFHLGGKRHRYPGTHGVGRWGDGHAHLIGRLNVDIQHTGSVPPVVIHQDRPASQRIPGDSNAEIRRRSAGCRMTATDHPRVIGLPLLCGVDITRLGNTGIDLTRDRWNIQGRIAGICFPAVVLPENATGRQQPENGNM